MPEAPLPSALVDGWLAWGASIAEPQTADRTAGLIGHGDFIWAAQEHPERAWEAIVALVASPEGHRFLGLLAAGPVEDLLSRHGPQFIDRVETAARSNATFASMLSGVWQFTMSDEIWSRVQAVKGPDLSGQVNSETPNSTVVRTSQSVRLDARMLKTTGEVVVIRNAVLFLAALLLALTAGRAFWIWLGENPFNMSGQTYVEFFQQLDKRIAVPIAITGIGGTILAGTSAVLHRTDRRVFYLLAFACGLGLVGDLVTLLVNVPINNELATWNPADLPADYRDYLLRWWQWHHVRLVAMFVATCLVLAAMLGRNSYSAGAPVAGVPGA